MILMSVDQPERDVIANRIAAIPKQAGAEMIKQCWPSPFAQPVSLEFPVLERLAHIKQNKLLKDEYSALSTLGDDFPGGNFREQLLRFLLYT